MATEPEGPADWTQLLLDQGISQEMIDQARRAAAGMTRAASDLFPDPREPMAPDAYARQLAEMARREPKAKS